MQLKAPVGVALHRRQRYPSQRLSGVLPLFTVLFAATFNLTKPITWLRGKPMWPISGAAVGYSFQVATTSTTDGTSFVSGAFTPPSNSLLAAMVVASDSTIANTTMTDSNSLGFTLIQRVLFNTSTSQCAWFICNSPAVNSSMTVTFNAGATITGAAITVYAITGVARYGTTAVRQFASGSGVAGATPQAFFGKNSVTTNIVLSVVGNITNPGGVAVPANSTRDSDGGYGTPATGYDVASRTGQTLNGIIWGSTSASAWGCLVCEIDASTQNCVQSRSGTGTASSTTVALQFRANVLTGCGIAAFVYWNSGSTTCTVSGSVNGSLSLMAAVLRGSGGLSGYSFQGFRKTGGTAGSETITATFSSAATDYGMVIEEIPASYSSWDTATATNYNGTSPQAPNTGSFTVNHSNAFILAAGLFATSPYALDANGFQTEELIGFAGNVVQDKTIGGATPQTATWGTGAATDVATIIGNFYQPGGGGGTTDSVGMIPVGF